MMPWNPIHRYAGVQSSFDTAAGVPSDPFGAPAPRRPEPLFGHAYGIDGGELTPRPHRPLGFVDVRSEAADDSAHEDGPVDEPEALTTGHAETADEEAEAEPVAAAQAEPAGTDEPAETDEPARTGEPAPLEWVLEPEQPGVMSDGDAAWEPEPEPAQTWAEAEAEEKVPFYKREIGFGRGKKASEPVPATAAPAAWPVEREEPIAAASASDDDKLPFYKKEISLRRRRDPVAQPSLELVDQPEAAPAAAAEEVVAEATARDEDASGPETVEQHEVVAEVDERAAEPVSEPIAESEPEAETPSADVEDHLEWPEEARAEHAPAAPEPTAPAAPAHEEPVEIPIPEPTPVPVATAKTPLRKRELSFGKSSGTKRSNGRGGGRHDKVVGLKIGASQLAAAVVEEHNGRPELVELARSPLEAGIVVDGEIRDAEALTNALRSFFSENKLPTKDVRVGIASNRIGVRTFEIAGVEDDARFDNAVRFKAHEVLPIAVNESVLDYRVLDERRAATGEVTRRILLVVAPREQVAPYAEVAQRAGLKLAGIDLEALGLLRAFVEPQEVGARKATDTATVVVAIGHEASTLLVAGGGVCEFTRVFDWGGGTLQEAIAQELEVRPAEAGTILRHLSLAGASARIEGIDDEARSKALEAVRLRLTPFARELVSSLQFYQTQPDSLGIGEIVITGGTSQLDGLADALHQMIGVAVRVGDPLQRVAVRKGVETGFEHVIGSLSVAIGLGIDDGAVRSVDLMPRDLPKTKRGRAPQLSPALLPIAAVIPLAALGFLFYQAHNKVTDKQSQLADLQAQYARLPVPKGPQIDAALKGLQAQRASAVAQVLGSRPAWDGMLADFARVLPANVWLTALSAKTPNPLSTPPVVATPGTSSTSSTPPATVPVSTTPTGVTIQGYTYNQADVAKLLARLTALPSLQNVQLQGSSVAAVGNKNVIQFTILADMREAGGGA